MPRALWLPGVLQRAGLRVYVASGWEKRGANGPILWFNPQGVIWHHAATSPLLSTAALLKLLIDGRADLPGPLANLALERDGTFYVLASGRANHAGKGSWLGLDSNYEVMGIEPANDGRGEPWPQVQLDAYRRGTRALIDQLGVSVAWVAGHKEWAPTRKIDPYGLSMHVQRTLIAEVEEPMTKTQARIELAAAWHEKSGVWMTPQPPETAQGRLTRLASEVAAKIRTVDEIVQFAPVKPGPSMSEPIPSWVLDPSIPS
jgi:hypothetical protein